ncbi:hypothetical protein [Nocardioides mesophilus]|uniref:Uncharacterized protein n=1 Tax=Nocardioides mesophilus TaxID=433659 RepID=A0A7G9RAW7_9ACTN|nr:hypothetical protein [Nocardioides mesophilus]QNN52742.1 hypothetical protein H9L09_20270 [Nocardioides mesophilus]
MHEASVRDVDPFDLPDWLGTGDVTWTAGTGLHTGHLVRGELSGEDGRLTCDLLAADRAFPQPVLDEEWRRRAHQAWTYGQVVLVDYDDRLTLAVPGTAFSAELALDAVGRLAKAVGARPGRFLVALRL